MESQTQFTTKLLICMCKMFMYTYLAMCSIDQVLFQRAMTKMLGTGSIKNKIAGNLSLI